MTTYLTADHHFGHTNIIEYCNRPYRDAREMDEKLIENWNSIVGRDDTVIHLGDFAFTVKQQVLNNLFSRLRGNIIIIAGNHDNPRRLRKVPNLQIWQAGLHTIDGRRYYLDHYPKDNWDGRGAGIIQFHGHSHGIGRGVRGKLDVGVDPMGGYPVALEEAVQLATLAMTAVLNPLAV